MFENFSAVVYAGRPDPEKREVLQLSMLHTSGEADLVLFRNYVVINPLTDRMRTIFGAKSNVTTAVSKVGLTNMCKKEDQCRRAKTT